MKCICLSLGGYAYHSLRWRCPVHMHLPPFQKIEDHDVPLSSAWAAWLLAISLGSAAIFVGYSLHLFFVLATR